MRAKQGDINGVQASVMAAVEATCSEVHAARRAGPAVVCVTGSLHVVAQALRELPLGQCIVEERQ